MLKFFLVHIGVKGPEYFPDDMDAKEHEAIDHLYDSSIDDTGLCSAVCFFGSVINSFAVLKLRTRL